MDFASSIANAEGGKDDTCVTCDMSAVPRVAAVILYPSLGCPMVLAPSQGKARMVIGVSSSDGKRFAVDDDGIAHAAHPYIDRHLRLCSIDKKDPDTDTTQGTLFSDGKGYGTARSALKTRFIGTFLSQGSVLCTDGMAFNISPAAMQLYRELDGGHLYEIEIDLSVAPFNNISSSGFHSFAWMVELTPTEKKAWPETTKPRAAHYQDLLINGFLQGLQPQRGKIVEALYECDVSQTTPSRPGAPDSSRPHLQAWHPVIRATTDTLKLGHLSDVHVSVRQHVMASSPVAMLENAEDAGKLAQRFIGDKLCNSFLHLKTLVEAIGVRKTPDTALLLTGDLIDFNRNLNPRGAGKAVGEQWKAFNVLANIDNAELYPRWQDDMQIYSLLRHCYTQLKLPVYMTTGNHEAYETPYGISPRVGAWGATLGAMEVFRHSEKTIANHRRDLEAASLFSATKANSGIAADHNLTIYEATLAYGPTYGQTFTTFNYNPANFDWFGALFNPLGDFLIGLGGANGTSDAKQLIAALAWGEVENYQNLDDLAAPGGVDRQGPMILPRAASSLSGPQQALLLRAQALKRGSGASLVVASHFTVFSYAQDTTLGDPAAGMSPTDRPSGNSTSHACFTAYNMGTCEWNLKWYFDNLVLGNGPNVDWHFSGHSHRAGVYIPRRGPQIAHGGANKLRVDVASARDPGLDGAQTSDGKMTNFVVSSCGGPIGYQNLGGELGGWTLRPPAGSVLDTKKKSVEQVRSDHGTGRPRLAVALDYLHVMNPGKAPLGFEWAPRTGLMSRNRAESVRLILSDEMKKLNCIAEVKVWVFALKKSKVSGTGDAESAWHCLKPTLSQSKSGATLTFSRNELLTLQAAMVPSDRSGALDSKTSAFRKGEGARVTERAAQAFCHVLLKKPTIAKGQPDWSADMNIEDPWLFPLDVGTAQVGSVAVDFMRRRAGEYGEIPDWAFLALNFQSKGYIPAKEAIKVKYQRVDH